MFFKKKPKRLYYPVQANWYTKPRRKPSVGRPNKFSRAKFRDIAKKLPQLIFAIIAFIILLFFLTFSSYFSVKNIKVARESLNIDSAAIENKLNKYIGKNIIFFPKSRIYNAIQADFPEFASVKIQKSLPSTISIYLESYPIIANLKAYYIPPQKEELAATDSAELNKAVKDLLTTAKDSQISGYTNPLSDKKVTSGAFDLTGSAKKDTAPKQTEQKSLLNSIGQAIFDKEENLELITVTIRDLDAAVKDREQVIKKEHMDYIMGAIQYFKNAMKLEISGFGYLPKAREIHLKTTKNLVIWISIERDYKEQIDKLSTIYEAAELNKENLSYIDLRIRNKLIYCPVGMRCATIFK